MALAWNREVIEFPLFAIAAEDSQLLSLRSWKTAEIEFHFATIPGAYLKEPHPEYMSNMTYRQCELGAYPPFTRNYEPAVPSSHLNFSWFLVQIRIYSKITDRSGGKLHCPEPRKNVERHN